MVQKPHFTAQLGAGYTLVSARLKRYPNLEGGAHLAPIKWGKEVYWKKVGGFNLGGLLVKALETLIACCIA